MSTHRSSLTLAGLLIVTLAVATLLPAAETPAQGEPWLPVGYDHPELDRGGPYVSEGPAWMDYAWSRVLKLAPKPAWKPLTVVMMTNFQTPAYAYELKRRFPADIAVIQSTNMASFTGRDAFFKALNEHPKVDVFLISRVAQNSIPTDVQAEMLRRTREDGAGILVVDIFDHSPTFNPEFLGLKPEKSSPELIPGIPYPGLRKYSTTKTTSYVALNCWNTYGVIATDPATQPQKYGDCWQASFGKGRIVWISTDSGWERGYGGRAPLPDVNQRRDMWVETEYFYSHVAKSLLLAAQTPQAARIMMLTPNGPTNAAETPTITCRTADQKTFVGTLRWQIRDTWGVVTDSGSEKATITDGAAAKLPSVRFKNGGRQFLDVWLEADRGDTVDWASAFINFDRGVASPEIAPTYPEGTPRGAALEGTVTVKTPPAGATLEVTLTDRYWRQVERLNSPLSEKNAYSFPARGLDGQIFTVEAIVRDKDNAVLARSNATVTAPFRCSPVGFYAVYAGGRNEFTPEMAGYREMLRRIGFRGQLQWGGGTRVTGEALLWNDLQSLPFPFAISAPTNEHQKEVITDWLEPELREQYIAATRQLVHELQPVGLRGFNLTDDCFPSGELTLGAYTVAAFHKWLAAQYGSFENTCKAWSWTPPVEELKADELPYDPYVTMQFHQWLKRKYGSLTDTAKAWKILPGCWGGLHTFGAIQREMVAKHKAGGATGPDADARAFMAEHVKSNPKRETFAGVHAAAIRKAFDAGTTGPWIDVQRFMQKAWVDDMVLIKDTARAIDPALWVGTQAASYTPDVYTRLDYIAPYYEDRLTKVAVSRGAARRPGLFGGCMGTYGDKAPTQTGRRATIWQTLFAGGTGIYYWMFAMDMGTTADLYLNDKHSRWQCEVLSEVTRGPGELFTGCQRIFHPALVLDSQLSTICDQLDAKKEPITSQPNSVGAFQYALEDLGVNPHTIEDTDLTDEFFRSNQTRLLVLPGVCSMSDRAVAVVRKFVEDGGTVVADVVPGLRMPNGTPRSSAPLADVFGVEHDVNGATKRVRGALACQGTDFGEALADPRVKAVKAQAGGAIAKAPVLLENAFGRGRAFLMNASFSTYPAHRTEGGDLWRAWNGLMKRISQAANLKPEFTWTSGGRETPGVEISGFRNGRGYLLGVEDLATADSQDARRTVEIALPARFYVYDIRRGSFVGQTDVLKADLPRGGHRAYSLMPYNVTGVDAKLNKANAARGDTVVLSTDLTLEPPGKRDLHVLRVEVVDPAGKTFYPFERVVRMPETGPLALEFTTSVDDPAGDWRVVVTDVNTGVAARLPLTLK